MQQADGMTVLLADDQELLRDVIRELLEREGYRVVTACDGQEAVALFHYHREAISLGVFDIAMPGLSGPQAAQQILDVQPDLPFVFVTGFDLQGAFDQAPGLRAFPVLGKPVDFDHLLRTIEACVARE